MDLVAFGIIIDRVLAPDGGGAPNALGREASSLLGREASSEAFFSLGGGGPQTAFGMALWSERVGLAARVGADLPPEARAWLEESGIDLAGVRQTRWPTLRATQHISADGRRAQTWQSPPEAIRAQLRRSVDDLPESYRRARGWHVGVHPDSPDHDFLAGLRAANPNGVLSVEPFKPADAPLGADALAALLVSGQVFSPNLLEAQSLAGAGEPLAVVRRLMDGGAQVVALRMAASGSIVAGAGRAARIPPVPVHVRGQVGAGNAYCGGFLAGWVQTGDVVEAGLRGAVSASFLLEQGGLPALTAIVRRVARERLGALRPRVEQLALA